MLELVTPATPAAPTPRGQYVRRQLVGALSALVELSLQAAAQERSTDSASLSDRAVMAALRPLLPQLRAQLFANLAELEPAGLERMAGAVSSAIESVLAYAPGDSELRFVIDWQPDGKLALVPDPRDSRHVIE